MVDLTEDPNPLFIAYAALGLMAVLPIYFGSYKSIKYEKPKTKQEQEEEEFFSFDDAKMFPLIGSASLFGLYVIFKFFDKEIVNYVVTAYFTLLGVGASTGLLLDVSRFVSGNAIKGIYHLRLHGKDPVVVVNDDNGDKSSKKKVDIDDKNNGYNQEVLSYHFGYYHIFLLIVCSCMGGYYAFTKHWLVSNLYGEAFALSAVQLLNLDSFKTGLMLLGGLFFYDVFWVFGTDVMVTVAKNFDGPIKVVFPKNIFDVIDLGIFSREEKLPFTMLGLGDIVIPGIFVALCLQFDWHLFKKTPQGKNAGKGTPFPAPYFKACFLAYCAGLFTTVYVMHNFKAAQPALLYLSPACSLAPLIVGLFKGQLKDLFDFDPQKEREQQDDDEKKSASPSKGKGKQKKAKQSDDDDGDDDDSIVQDEAPITPSKKKTRSKKKN